MLESTAAYRAAITGDVRWILLRAALNIISPDIVYGEGAASEMSRYSRLEQLHDKDVSPLTKYATLERGRWVLDGSFHIYPADPAQATGILAYQSQSLSGEDGTFPAPIWVEERFSGVTILQACSVFFSQDPNDGVPDTFTVEVRSGGATYYTKQFAGNTETSISLEGFTVQDPDAIRVTVTKWSMPSRRFRAVEIIPGIFEQWGSEMIASFDVMQQANFSSLALPYGTCTLTIDNSKRRFEPRNKQGIFKSIEDRQGIEISIGVQLPDGSVDYKPVGVYYQHSGGWKTGNNALTMQWSLVDIIGLLADRQYLPPATLPTTLDGWIASLVAQLGTNFTQRYYVDPAYAQLPLTVADREAVTGISCGDVLRYACMATGTFPRAANATGYLSVGPFWNQGNTVDLDNMSTYPVLQANEDLAAIVFTVYDGSESGTEYIVAGNSAASTNTVSVQNPFIHTIAAANTAARLILSTYGGNKMAITGRGDPSSEIGDVETVWLDESSAATGRMMQQGFRIAGGVMRDCQSVLLQANGLFRFDGVAIITESGEFTAPADAAGNLFAIVVGGGDGSSPGTDGTFEADGTPGADGLGAMVWAGTVPIAQGQTFTVSLGAGGAPGQSGTATTFGTYSSANGQRYSPSYTDVRSGTAYARTGVPAPQPNSGDGAKGGAGGMRGNRHLSGGSWVVDTPPTLGEPGKAGGSGIVVVYWTKEAT